MEVAADESLDWWAGRGAGRERAARGERSGVERGQEAPELGGVQCVSPVHAVVWAPPSSRTMRGMGEETKNGIRSPQSDFRWQRERWPWAKH